MKRDDADRAEFSQRVFDQFMQLFVMPEIKARQQSGRAQKPLNLHSAQVVFYPDGRSPMVRLNSEVVALGEVRLKEGITKKPGEPIYTNEVAGFDSIKLHGDEAQDCGHATLIRLGDTWSIAFDFRYNKSLSKRHLQTAQEFFDAAVVSCERKQWSAFADTLFSAAELTAKALLLSMPDPKFRKKASHGAVHSKFNRFASLGNVEQSQRQAFNSLSELRGRARYLKGELVLGEARAAALLKGVKDLITYVSSRYPAQS